MADLLSLGSRTLWWSRLARSLPIRNHRTPPQPRYVNGKRGDSVKIHGRRDRRRNQEPPFALPHQASMRSRTVRSLRESNPVRPGGRDGLSGDEAYAHTCAASRLPVAFTVVAILLTWRSTGPYRPRITRERTITTCRSSKKEAPTHDHREPHQLGVGGPPSSLP